MDAARDSRAAGAAPVPAGKVAFLGTYLPRQCGIATFTFDLRQAVAALPGAGPCPVIAMNDGAETYAYPPEVTGQITERNPASYERAAALLNASGADVLCLQHEFGIFGGDAGRNILALLRALTIPVVTTLHTVLRDPTPEQRQVTEALIRYSERLVVMTERGRMFLREIYGAPAGKIDLIAHGIHDVPFEPSEGYKAALAVEGRRVLLTFGLLSPNKGIEYVLDALPAVIAEFPEVVYLVLGATHPNLIREQGEAYRLRLDRLARANGVAEHVIFHNRFVGLSELKEFIGAADIYLTPYLIEQQIVSGTLAYAFGAGKTVVSTPYWHAAELLADGRGVLVPFADSGAIAREVCALLHDGPRCLALRQRAHAIGRGMVWSRAADHYREAFARAGVQHRNRMLIRSQAPAILDLPRFNPAHLLRLSDSTGMLQHALLAIPHRMHGYCTDDNARALLLTVLRAELGPATAALDRLATTSAAFLLHAFDPATHRFRNFMGYDRRWSEEPGSEDAHGRAVWALGACAAQPGDGGLRQFAVELFHAALLAVDGLTHPRTWAFVLLGVHAYLRRRPNDSLVRDVRERLVARLLKRFAEHSRGNWNWLADDATYDNACLPHALILCGRDTRQPRVLETGLQSLHWLVAMQTAPGGWFQPIGSDGFCHRNGRRAFFDQQPVEIQATVAACLAAFAATRENSWLERAQMAFEWFLGRNDLGLVIYDSATGGCRDALHADRVNENEGAESTLAFHLALAAMEIARRDLRSEIAPSADPQPAAAVAA